MMYLTETKTWMCSVCNKESKKKNDIWRHVESLHVENHPGYSCSYCGDILKSKNALRQHVNMKHV